MADRAHATFLKELAKLTDRGFALVPIPLQKKRPVITDWQNLHLTVADLPGAFPRISNVGALLGEPSGWIVDVDIDSSEAMLIAGHFLIATPARFGHGATPESHWLYRASGPVTTVKYRDPTVEQHDREHAASLIELRSTGSQTVVPPSVHVSGEPIRWASEGDPAAIDGLRLRRLVATIAAAALLGRHWPGRGSRHDAALALAGGLLRAWPVDAVRAFMDAVVLVAGDDESRDRLRTVLSTDEALTDGSPATGWPTLKTLIDPRVVDRVLAWLEIQTDPAVSLAAYEPFPVHVFPGVIERFVTEGATAMGIPIEFIVMPLLAFAAGLVGNLLVLEIKASWRETAILWTAVVGAPGSGKSPGLSYVQQLVDELQTSAWTAYQAEMATWRSNRDGASLKDKVRGSSSATQPKLKSYFTTDATLEAIAVMISEVPGLIVIRDELVGWIRAHDAYRAAGDRQAWLQLWTGGTLKIDRKSTATIFVPRPAISVTGGMQPDRVRELQEDAATNDGFADRFLLAWPDADPPAWTDEDVDPVTIAEAKQRFRRLRVDATGAVYKEAKTTLEPKARERWISWYNANTRSTTMAKGLAAGWSAKFPRQVLRIALVLHALHHPDDRIRPVSLATLDGAIAIVECLRSHLQRVLPAIGQPAAKPGSGGVSSRVHGILRRQHGEWISRTDLHDQLGGNVRAETLTSVLGQLEDEGVAEQRVVPTEGRPRVEWRLSRGERTRAEDAAGMDTASFVASIVPETREAVSMTPTPFVASTPAGTCCLCGEPLEEGRSLVCPACQESETRRNRAIFGESPEDAA